MPQLAQAGESIILRDGGVASGVEAAWRRVSTPTSRRVRDQETSLPRRARDLTGLATRRCDAFRRSRGPLPESVRRTGARWRDSPEVDLTEAEIAVEEVAAGEPSIQAGFHARDGAIGGTSPSSPASLSVPYAVFEALRRYSQRAEGVFHALRFRKANDRELALDQRHGGLYGLTFSCRDLRDAGG